MAQIDFQYHMLLKGILESGFDYEDPNRKGVIRKQVQSRNFIYELSEGFPAITTKKLYWKGVVGELLWFLRGSTDIRELWKLNIHIWDKDWWNYAGHEYVNWKNLEEAIHNFENDINNVGEDFYDLGRIYPAQWRDFKGGVLIRENGGIWPDSIDQIANLIQRLKDTPMATNHIVTAWNPAELNDMALPPCHWSFEILVQPISIMKRKLMLSTIKSAEDIDKIPMYEFDLKWHQRSVDTFLGLPFNIASYALLAYIIGKLTNMIPKRIIGDLSNVHIYDNHIDAVKEQLTREHDKYGKCKLEWEVLDLLAKEFWNRVNQKGMKEALDETFKILSDDIENANLVGYESYPTIKAEMLAYNK